MWPQISPAAAGILNCCLSACVPTTCPVMPLWWSPTYHVTSSVPLLICGDFNYVALDTTLHAFFKYVDCYARRNISIDVRICNICNIIIILQWFPKVCTGESRPQPYSASASLQTEGEAATHNISLIQEVVFWGSAGFERPLQHHITGMHCMG